MKQLLLFLLVASIAAEEVSIADVLQRAEEASATMLSTSDAIISLDSTKENYVTGANPELSVGTENFGVSEIELVISQDIRFKSKREPIQLQLDITRKELQIESEISRRELSLAVTEAYLTAAKLSDMIALTDELILSVKSELLQIEERISRGVGSKLEQLEQRSLLSELNGERFALEGEYRGALAILNSFIEGESIESVQSLDELAETFHIHNLSTIPENHPELVKLALEEDRVELKTMESRALQTPDFNINSGYKRNNEAGENAFLLGFSLGLPFNRDSDIAVNEAAVMERSLSFTRNEVTRQLSAELVLLQEESNIAERRLKIIRDERIPLAEEILDVAKGQFRRGILSVRDKIIYQQELINLRGEELDLLNLYYTARANELIFTQNFEGME